MICNHCGCPNPAGRDYCQNCGQPFAPSAYPSPVVGSYPAPEPPAVQTLRRFGSSGLLLALAILFSVNSLLTGLGAVFTSSYTVNGHTYASTESVFSAAVSGLLGAAVPALFAAGFWILFANCKNPARPLRTGSFTLLKAMVIVQQVAGWLVAACLALFLFVLFVAALAGGLDQLEQSVRYGNFLSVSFAPHAAVPQLLARSGAEAEMLALMLLLAAYLILMLTLLIVFTFKLLRTIRALQYTVHTGKSSDDIPGSAAVFSYILAGVSALSALYGGWNIPTALIGAATYILLGLLLCRYKREMRWLMCCGDPVVTQGYFTCVYQPAFQPALSQQGFQSGPMPAQGGDITGYCAHCGGPLRENDRICAYCGWPR